MIFKKSSVPPPASAAQWLEQAVRAELPGREDAVIQLVVSIAGLLGAAAYADRKILSAEVDALQAQLGRVEGMTGDGAARIVTVLQQHARELTTLEVPRYTRALRELGDAELRCHVLEALVELAASDGEISSDEVQRLRTITSALGLSQADYNAAQDKHRSKLSVLLPP